jgi:beta-xylosidase
VKDEFNSPILGTHWSWIREDKSNWSLTSQPGSLVLQSDSGDITETNNNAKNMLLQAANTDWTIETKIVCSRRPTAFTENAGIVAYQDDDNFVKLAYRPSFGRRSFRRGAPGEQPGSVELLIENGGAQKLSGTLNMEGIITEDNTLLLKLEKQGDLYTAYVSSDGKQFEFVEAGNVVLRDIQAGVMACDGVLPARFAAFRRFMQRGNPPATPFEVAFDYFHIDNSGMK